MTHTRENLERLTDLRNEIDQQLEKLDKQAKAAQRFRELRQVERRLHASVLLLQWQTLQSETAERLAAQPTGTKLPNPKRLRATVTRTISAITRQTKCG